MRQAQTRDLWLLTLPLVMALSNGCADSAPTEIGDGDEGPAPAATGSLNVTTITTGSLLDSDGYAVLVDGQGRWIAINGTLEIPSVMPGERVVDLDGVQSNCATSGPNPRTITVLEGETTSTTFEVGCEFIIGSIAFVSTRNGVQDIYTMDVDGANPVNVSSDSHRWEDGPAWSPDGTKLAWGADGDIYFLDLEATLPPTRVTFVGDASEPSWAPDARRIAFNRDEYDWLTDVYVDLGIWIVDADGSNLVQLAAGGTQPAWSPVASRIAFTRDPGNPDIYVIDADGSGLARLTVDGGRDPAWSPDGSQIAFRTDRDGNGEIYVMRADGSRQVRLTNDPSRDEEPAWSPDGQWIAFTRSAMSASIGAEIYLMDRYGANQVNLTKNAARDWSPSWMPEPPK